MNSKTGIRSVEPALNISVSDIYEGNFIKNNGAGDRFLVLNSKKFNKISLIGIVVDKGENFIVVDDGSGKIAVKNSSPTNINNINSGMCVNIIGRINEIDNERYVIGEIIKKINIGWLKYRQQELKHQKSRENSKEKKATETPESINEKEIETSIIDENKEPEKTHNSVKEEVKLSPAEKIFCKIKELDSGNGVLIDEVINSCNVENAEKIIERMLEEGEIFQLKRGIVKVVE